MHFIKVKLKFLWSEGIYERSKYNIVIYFEDAILKMPKITTAKSTNTIIR